MSGKNEWLVTMECVVRKLVTVDGEASEEEVRADPWDLAIDEMEIDQVDWKVIKVERAK